MAVSLRRRTIPIILSLAFVVFVVGAWAWWHSVRSNPKRVFEAMLVNSLKIRGVTDHVQQSSDNQHLNQIVELMSSPANTVHAQTTLSQDGDNAASVITETIGTPFTDFVRYTDISTSQKDASGKSLDFSKVKGIWGKTSSVEGSDQTTGQLYNQMVLSVVPLTNLPAAQRKDLIHKIKTQDVYSPDYTNVKRDIKNGRPEYTYTVTVKPQPYISMLKLLGRDVGLTQLENVDPASYSNAAPLEFKLTVDVWTRQLTSIAYSSGDRSEKLSSFGLERFVKAPTDSISIDELQTRIQSLQ